MGFYQITGHLVAFQLFLEKLLVLWSLWRLFIGQQQLCRVSICKSTRCFKGNFDF